VLVFEWNRHRLLLIGKRTTNQSPIRWRWIDSYPPNPYLGKSLAALEPFSLTFVDPTSVSIAAMASNSLPQTDDSAAGAYLRHFCPFCQAETPHQRVEGNPSEDSTSESASDFELLTCLSCEAFSLR